MRVPLLTAALCCLAGSMAAQDDLIVLRDGSELAVKVIQVDGRLVTYKERAKAKRELYQDLRDVYMIRYEKRGNIYITDDGKRITGENEKWDKSADRIYLVEGREIQAYNLSVRADRITYSLGSGKGLFKKKSSTYMSQSVSPQDVFMIKYADGTKDIITDITRKEEPAEEEQTVAEAQENERQVVFHNVKKGETLKSIAQRYDVSAKEIIEWNDLPKNTKPTARLQSGTQLMIYVEPTAEE